MEEKILPGAEAALQGEMVPLHLDLDQVQKLTGEDKKLADELMKGLGDGVPVERVFNVDGSNFTQTKEQVGAFDSPAELEQFLKDGGVGQKQKPGDVGQKLSDVAKKLSDVGQKPGDVGKKFSDVGQKLSDDAKKLFGDLGK
jgi:hypothetical protein